MEEPDNTWDAWLAGFVDGEGCLGFRRYDNQYRTPRLQISNTDRALLQEIQSREGGSIVGLIRRSAKHSPAWIWSLGGVALVTLLARIRPYLRVKQYQAWLVLECAALVPSKSGRRLSDEDKALRKGFALATSSLNGRRGA